MDYESMSREELLNVLRELQQVQTQKQEDLPEARRVLHQLQVHQIELEMQNRELRDAQGALEESRNRYANLYDFAPVAYCTLDDRGRVDELNLTAATLFGVERDQARGRFFTTLTGLEDPRQFWQHLGTCGATQQPVVSELSLCLGGRTVHVEAVSVPEVQLGRPICHFRTALTDITRRKAAERERAEAHRSEQQLRERLQALDAAHVEISARLASNPGAALADLAQIIARHARVMMQADLAHLQLATDGLGEAEEHGQCISRVEGEGSERSPQRLEIELEYAGRVLGILRLLRAPHGEPFSERDAETLRMFASRVSSGLQIAALQAVEARENERLWLLERVGRELGRTHEQSGVKAAIGDVLDAMRPRFCDGALLYLRHEAQLALAHASFGALDPSQAPRLSDESLLARIDGWLAALREPRPRAFDASSQPERSVSELDVPQLLSRALEASSLLLVPLVVRGQALGLLGFSRGEGRPGFTPVEESWGEEIGVRCGLSLDNAHLFEELRAALDWRETLLATISHDLKSPLNAISLSASALAPEEPLQERRKTGRQVDLIRRSADYMNHMVNDLLLENMFASGGFQLELGRHAAGQLVADACHISEPLTEARGLSLDQHVENGLPDVTVDRERLLRVFTNLIGNAAKFSPKGGSIRVRAERRDATVVFSVSDSGPGIAPEQQPLLFKRYWRGNKGPRGLGLGLYIAKTMVEAHGGAISVTSTPGEGATFAFSVPLSPR